MEKELKRPDISSFLDDSHRPPYNRSYQDIAEIFQGELGITNSDDPKPVLATYGVGPCVAFTGWAPKQKAGFLAHYDGLTDLSESFEVLLYWTSKSVRDLPIEFDVRLIQGDWPDKKIIDFIKARLNMRSDIPMKLVEEDVGVAMCKSIALDTRTGQTYSYDPMQNPQTRDIPELEIMLTAAGVEYEARFTYKPQPTSIRRFSLSDFLRLPKKIINFCFD